MNGLTQSSNCLDLSGSNIFCSKREPPATCRLYASQTNVFPARITFISVSTYSEKSGGQLTQKKIMHVWTCIYFHLDKYKINPDIGLAPTLLLVVPKERGCTNFIYFPPLAGLPQSLKNSLLSVVGNSPVQRMRGAWGWWWGSLKSASCPLPF